MKYSVTHDSRLLDSSSLVVIEGHRASLVISRDDRRKAYVLFMGSNCCENLEKTRPSEWGPGKRVEDHDVKV